MCENLKRRSFRNQFQLQYDNTRLTRQGVQEICPTSPPWTSCNLVYEFALTSNGQVQNISSIPAIISKLQPLNFYLRFIKKSIKNLQGYRLFAFQ